MRLGKDSLEYIESKLIREKTMKCAFCDKPVDDSIRVIRVETDVFSINNVLYISGNWEDQCVKEENVCQECFDNDNPVKVVNSTPFRSKSKFNILEGRMDEAIASANYQELESILDEILAFSNSVSRDMMKKVFRGMLKKEIGALVAYIKEADDEDNPFYTNTELEKAKLSIVSYFLDDLEESNERVISNNQLHI